MPVVDIEIRKENKVWHLNPPKITFGQFKNMLRELWSRENCPPTIVVGGVPFFRNDSEIVTIQGYNNIQWQI